MGSQRSGTRYTVEDYRRTLEKIELTEESVRLEIASLRALRTVAGAQHDFLRQAGLLDEIPSDADPAPVYPRGADGVLLVLLDFFPNPADTRQLLEAAQTSDAVDPESPHGSSILGTTLRRLAARGLASRDGRQWVLTDAGYEAADALLEEE